MKRLLLIALSALTLLALPLALGAEPRNPGVIFLLIEPGSRPGAMAGAYVAQVDDAYANYWNLGALAFNRKTQVAGMHTNWFGDVDGIDDIYLEYLAWNQYVEDVGNIGINVTYLTLGSQERRDEDGNELGTFDSYEVAAGVTYGYQLTENVGVGVGFKFIFSDLAPEETGASSSQKGQGSSFAFDFGLKSRGIYLGDYIDLPQLDYGLSITNIGPNITYINDAQSDPLPLNFRMGFSYRAMESEFNKLTINADMDKTLANDDPAIARLVTAWGDEDSSVEIDDTIFRLGAEYVYMNLIALRGGYLYDKGGSMEGACFGAGLQYTFGGEYLVRFDFAMQEAGDLTDYNKTFSASVEF